MGRTCTGTKIPETDSVLTTGEIQQLLDEEGVDLASCPEEDFDSIFPENRKQKRLIGRPGVSGEFHAFWRIDNRPPPPERLSDI